MLDKTLKNNRIAILGLGWLGETLAKKLINKGADLKGSTTSIEKKEQLSKHFLNVEDIKIEANSIAGDWITFIKNVSILIINFPPKRIPNIETIYPNQIKQIITHTPKTVKVIFVSSTSVYGASEIPIKETINANPIKKSGIAVLKAENVLRGYFGEHLTVLRLAGLIGPNRHPGKFLAGKQNLKGPDAPVNLIHRDDCIGLIEAIINKNCFGEIINGCASVHPLRKPFYAKAAKSISLIPPHFEESNSNMKIIDNSKSKKILGYKYIYDNPEHIFLKKKI